MTTTYATPPSRQLYVQKLSTSKLKSTWKYFSSFSWLTLEIRIDDWFGILKQGSGLPDFSWYMIPTLEKCTKWTQYVPNGHKISQMSIKYKKWPKNISTFSNLRPSKIYPNWDFWKQTIWQPWQGCDFFALNFLFFFSFFIALFNSPCLEMLGVFSLR
jgi:hypothetical protein